MKFNLKCWTLLALALPFFLTSCQKQEDPTTALKSFFEKVNAKDIDGAAKFATKNSKTTLDLLKKGAEASGEESASSKDDMKDLEYGKPTIEGSKATIAVTNKKDKTKVDFTMIKEDGAWKVDFTMETLMKMGQQSMQNESSTPMGEESTTPTPEQ
jgi:hypothetical protein